MENKKMSLWKQSKPYLAGLQFALLIAFYSNNRIQYHYCIWSNPHQGND